MEPALIALIGTIFGGAGVKLAEKLLNRKRERHDLAADIREELRKDLESVRLELQRTAEALKEARNDLDGWKEKYYTLLEEMINLKTKIEISAQEVRDRQNKNIDNDE